MNARISSVATYPGQQTLASWSAGTLLHHHLLFCSVTVCELVLATRISHSNPHCYPSITSFLCSVIEGLTWLIILSSCWVTNHWNWPLTSLWWSTIPFFGGVDFTAVVDNPTHGTDMVKKEMLERLGSEILCLKNNSLSLNRNSEFFRPLSAHRFCPHEVIVTC